MLNKAARASRTLHLVLLLVVATASPLSSVADDGAGDTLTTKSYVVTITSDCAEGNVDCNDVTYHGVSRQTGKAITLKGTTLHNKCGDGITPCRFLGYQFKNGNITYWVLESGSLQVIRGKNEVLLDEDGQWQ
jgi:hypothetical protein